MNPNKKRIFKTETRPHDKIMDVASYCHKFMAENPATKIYVGTDSQNKRRKTTYVTVVALRPGTRGVHVLYFKENIQKNRDIYTRLWKECEMSVELAEYLREAGLSVYQIDLDFNDDESYESNRVASGAAGWIEGLGYRAGTKPAELVATKAADHLCRR